MSRIRLLAPARQEYLAAVRYYRDEIDDVELGRDFIAKFRERVDRIQRVRSGGALVTGLEAAIEVRRVKLRRFPFHVFFATLEAEIIVIAVAHERRQPEYWTHRLEDLEG